MLPLDLLNELITLLDDASTYHVFALVSRITSKLCSKDVESAKKRFSMVSNYVDDNYCEGMRYQLPDSTLHGPVLSYYHARYVVYLNGKREGPCWEWYGFSKHRYCRCYFQNGLLHGKYERWDSEGDVLDTMYYNKGNRIKL